MRSAYLAPIVGCDKETGTVVAMPEGQTQGQRQAQRQDQSEWQGQSHQTVLYSFSKASLESSAASLFCQISTLRA